MNMMKKTIHLQSGLLKNPSAFISHIRSLGCRCALITDEIVASLYGESLCQILRGAGVTTDLFSFPTGEIFKTRETKQQLEDQLLQKGYGRDSCILALGGGVVTDLAGYLAATYCRGVPVIMVPTTLLAMVDASLGGKNGVNVSQGKNLIGTFYQPQSIWIDPDILATLPLCELKNGIVEMIKHGLISDTPYFAFMETQAEKILSLDPDTIKKAIKGSCEIKMAIVEEDEREAGRRHLLNFGHTVGHALELLTDYRLSHGEAVALGILFESHLAFLQGTIDHFSFESIKNIFNRYSIPLEFPSSFSFDDLIVAMALDKKSVNHTPRFILLNDRRPPQCVNVDSTLLKTTFEWIQNFSRSSIYKVELTV